MATKESTVYLRNKRPNGIVFHHDGIRYKLEHRGHRQDSVALPADALQDATISRWIQLGQLEKISKESFMKLGLRTEDMRPNAFLKRPMREGRGIEVPMTKAESDTTGSLSVVHENDVNKVVKDSLSPKWAADLMSTEEEIEEFGYDKQDSSVNYPSRHRGDTNTRESGY